MMELFCLFVIFGYSEAIQGVPLILVPFTSFETSPV